MLLAIDAGNTNTVFAVFDEKKLLQKWRFATDHNKTADNYAIDLISLMQLQKIDPSEIKNVIISTVVPRNLYELKALSKKYFNCKNAKSLKVIGESNLDIGIKLKIEKPGEVGADRIVNAFAAHKKFGKASIILDFGTATTFDVVDEKASYLGGVIAPGVNLSLEALKNATAKLPDIEIKKSKKVIGKNTISAMQSGIYFGYAGLIEGICNQIKLELGRKSIKVIATGGLAELFAKEIKCINYLEPDLTIWGLNEIFLRNS